MTLDQARKENIKKENEFFTKPYCFAVGVITGLIVAFLLILALVALKGGF